MEPQAIARIRWYSQKEGGRAVLPLGPTYASVMQFEDGTEWWSIGLWLPDGAMPDEDGFQDNVEVGFIAREKVSQSLQEGKHLFIFEGKKVVAEAWITAVLA